MKKYNFWATIAHLAWTLNTPASEAIQKFESTLSVTEREEFKKIHDRLLCQLMSKCSNVICSQKVLNDSISNVIGLGEDVYKYCEQHPDEVPLFAPGEHFSDIFPLPKVNQVISSLPQSLKGIRVHITGVTSVSHSCIYSKIIAAGGEKAGRVTGTTRIVIAGSKCGIMRIRAAQKGIPVLTEADFIQMYRI